MMILYPTKALYVLSVVALDTEHDVNELRYILFSTKNQQTSQLPPTRDAMTKHIQRANYQAAIWDGVWNDTLTYQAQHVMVGILIGMFYRSTGCSCHRLLMHY